MDANQSTHEILQSSARKWARRFRLDADEIVSELFVEILSATDLPAEFSDFLVHRVRRVSENLAKRQRRFSQRNRVALPDVAVCHRVPRQDEVEELNTAELQKIALSVCVDDVERALVRVMLGEHPDFSTKADVFRAFGMNGTQAYRKSDALETRLKSVLRPHLN